MAIAEGGQGREMSGEALGGTAIQQAPLVIEWQRSALVRQTLQPGRAGRMPPGLEAARRHASLYPQREEGARLEGLDFLVTAHDQPQQRRLHASH